MGPLKDVEKPGHGLEALNVSSAVSPAVEALHTFIRSSVLALAQVGGEHPPSSESLLFLGAWTDALPRMLIEDPVLAPTDKIVWQVIKLRARARSATAFPSYQAIGRAANIRAQATVARAIAILRVSRWLTLCARVRDSQGRFRGNVYALHDEPLALADTVYLDGEYMCFLQTASTHRHGRVRSVAEAALATIADEIRQGVDVTIPRSPLERRVEALSTVHVEDQGGFFSFNRRRLERLRGRAAGRQRAGEPPSDSEDGATDGPLRSPRAFPDSGVKKFSRDDDPQRSSSPTKATTTTEELRFPDRLRGNHRVLARMYLDRIPGERRQAVLDELEGRLRAERRGAPPIYDPLRFLKKLCDAVVSGEFVENLGVAVHTERERARKSEERVRRDAAAPAMPPADPDNPLVQRALRLQALQASRKRDR